MKYTIFLVAILSLISCDSSKPAVENNPAPADGKARFGVSFISIGAGTDIKAKGQFDQFITAYGQKNNVKLKYDTVNWGREGEVDYCFLLTELDKKKQAQFILETKELLKKSSLVQYQENEACRQRNK